MGYNLCWISLCFQNINNCEILNNNPTSLLSIFVDLDFILCPRKGDNRGRPRLLDVLVISIRAPAWGGDSKNSQKLCVFAGK